MNVIRKYASMQKLIAYRPGQSTSSIPGRPGPVRHDHWFQQIERLGYAELQTIFRHPNLSPNQVTEGYPATSTARIHASLVNDIGWEWDGLGWAEQDEGSANVN